MNSESVNIAAVDEGRKRVIGIMAAILAARKLAQYEGGTRVPATVSAITDAVRWGEQIMAEIDRRYPAELAVACSLVILITLLAVNGK